MAKSGKYTDAAKMSFAMSFGAVGGFVVYLLVAMAFLVPGVIIILSQLKKTKAQRSTGLLVIGFVLAFIGVALGFGMGAGSVFDLLGDSFS